MRFSLLPTLLLPAAMLVPALASAQVNLKNGNFTAVAQDINLKSADNELELRRVYNSLKPTLGWFGWGWGSLFETRVIAMPDGTAVILENGSGLNRFYDPANGTPNSDTTNAIVKAITARDKLTPKAAATLRETLQKNEELRVRKVQQYGIRVDQPDGTLWNGRSCGKLLRTAEGYKRGGCENAIEYFDAKGRMVRRDEPGYSVRANYEGERVASIEDTAGKRILLSWTAGGRISKAVGVGGRTAEYNYNDRAELLSMVGGNMERFDYTYDANHRMTMLRLVDTTSWKLDYNDDGQVKLLRGRKGETTWYEYGVSPADPNRYWTRVTEVVGDGLPVTKTHEWSIAESSTGAHSVAAYSTADKETRYDSKGRITRTVKNGRLEMYGYDPKTGKLSAVLSGDSRIYYSYNSAGNLENARDEERAQSIDLTYDDNANIGTLVFVDTVNKERRKLSFKYNAMKKPVEIRLDGTGTLAVAYDDKGEITSVKAENDSRELPIIITQVFAKLKAMVQPAGLQLGL